MRGKEQNRRPGFTLIELLVVIAIIAILAAILFPIMMAAKRKGQAASCLGNMKQLGIACQAYYADFGEWGGLVGSSNMFNWPFIDPQREDDPWSGDSGRQSGVFKYIKSAGILQCPANKAPQLVIDQGLGIPPPGKRMIYAWSYTVNGDCPDGPDFDAFPSRSKMPMWVEENCDVTQLRFDGRGRPLGPAIINDFVFVGNDITSNRHNGRANICYADGHCGSLPGLLDHDKARWPDGSYIFRRIY